MKTTGKLISIVVPLFNDAWSISPLYGKIRSALEDTPIRWQCIFVDSGSDDNTSQILHELTEKDERVSAISLHRNVGIAQMIRAGFDNSTGEYLVTISGRLENEPKEIPLLLEQLENGYDVCVGWCAGEGGVLARKKPSKIFNWLISKICDLKIQDYECLMRAYRREIVERFGFYGDLERYLPIFAHWMGGRVCEIRVTQYPRAHGVENRRNAKRVQIKTLLELIVLKFLDQYTDRPFTLIVLLGMGSVLASFVTFISILVMKYYFDKPFVETPLPLIAVSFFLTGILLMVLGIMSVLLGRIYLTNSSHTMYSVKKKLGFERD